MEHTTTSLFPVFQSSALEELVALEDSQFGSGLVTELMTIFLRSTPQKIDHVLMAVKEGDFTRARKITHSMRSAAANLGALRFACVCQKFEDVSHTDARSCEVWAKELQTQFDEIRNVFVQFVA